MVRYPAGAARALAFLKAPFNDIAIFVEDTSKVDVWLALVRRSLPPNVRIRSVTPYGDRRSVIEACKADQSAGGPRRLYIIDADFDLLLSRSKPKLRHLYRLRAYCQENLYVGRQQAEALSQIFRPDDDPVVVGVEFQLFLEEQWGKRLRPLFATYACSYHLGGAEKTSSFHVSRLKMAGIQPPFPSNDAMRSRTRAIISDLRLKAPFADILASLEATRRRARVLPLSQVASGKTYILPLASQWLQHRFGISMTDHKLSLLLIAHSRHPLDAYLARRLRSIANSH